MATDSNGRAVGNANLRPFPKGQSGNPGGRKKTLTELVRRQTKDGAEIVAFMVAVLRGYPYEYPSLPPGPHKGVAFLPSPGERLEAAQWLADRAWGKAPTVVEALVDVDATVTHVEALRAHVSEADVDRLVGALLGEGRMGE
jgi:hypothetical protein